MRRNTLFGWWVLFGACACACACGSSSGSGSGDDDSTSSAVDQCNTLVSEYCIHVVGCAVDGGLVDAADQNGRVSSCKSDASQSLDCSSAVDVTTSYDYCVAELKSPDCAKVNQGLMDHTLALPPDCNGVIIVK